MKHPEIFSATLGLVPPWQITSVEFAQKGNRLDITVEYRGEGMMNCNSCGSISESHGAVIETWRHGDFFHHETFLHARVPRLCCPNCGDSRVERPWSRQGSKFHLAGACNFGP